MNEFCFRLRDPGSALTHFAGFVCAILATPFLLIHAVTNSTNVLKLSGLSIFMISMILLYGASSAYHRKYRPASGVLYSFPQRFSAERNKIPPQRQP